MTTAKHAGDRVVRELLLDRRATGSLVGGHLQPHAVIVTILLLSVLRFGYAGGPRDDATDPDWAFQRVVRPELPEPTVFRNEIDRFVNAKLAEQGWQPPPQSDSRSLLRRVYLDLIGLPPSLDDQESFLREPTAEQLDRVIDDLLARPSHGERWARHWLDVARYADSNGYEQDSEKPYAWRYRDYVIAALNEDKPFDRFLREQLAGDLLAEDTTEETIVATGFLRLGPWDSNPGNPQQARHDDLDDVVSTTAQAFLGLPMGCVRCHDQRPSGSLTQRDYYSFAGFFSSLERPVDDRNRYREAPVRAGRIHEVKRHDQAEHDIEEYTAKMTELREIARRRHLRSGASRLPAEAVHALLIDDPGQRSPEERALVSKYSDALNREVQAALTPDDSQRLAEYQGAIDNLRQTMPELMLAYAPKLFSKPETIRMLRLGVPGQETGEPLLPGVPNVCQATHELTRAKDRLDLANWMADPANPLTARVIVNRVWQHHFGQGLVRTPNDFTDAEGPSHPELLDWLADWFVHDAMWSLKELHRLILRSDTYRSKVMDQPILASSGRRMPSQSEGLPIHQNRLLWSYPQRRLDAEAIRDCVLAVSGQLNRRMYGPGFCPPVPKDILDSQRAYAATWRPADDDEARRRSVYIYVKRSLPYPILERLDGCDPSFSSPTRTTTTTAVQALVLFNSDFIAEQSQHFADRLLREAPDDRSAVHRAYLLALCRPPSPREEEAMLDFWLAETQARLAQSGASADDPRRAALAGLCRVIFNLNEFVYTP